MKTGKRWERERQLSLPGAIKGPENPWRTRPIVIRPKMTRGGTTFSTLELCAGGGGQALGFEAAGFFHSGLVEIDETACATLKSNRPMWNVLQADLSAFHAADYRGVDVVSAGLPCPPFSIAGKQLGQLDERNLFPALIRVVDEARPKAVMIENVRGILDAVFDDYRGFVEGELKKLGYQPGWKLTNAAEFGVPQLRLRVVFIAIKKEYAEHFAWPEGLGIQQRNVGDTLFDLISAKGWKGAEAWRKKANEVAPTIVGGSLKHGGPDLGPTRARKAWASLGVDGLGLADEPPSRTFVGMPRLTVRMVARLQGFPDGWEFSGGKTKAYRQVGNAFPPPVAKAIAESLHACLAHSRRRAAVAV